MQVVGVKFKEAGKISYYQVQDTELSLEDKVVAETIRGLEIGEVVNPGQEVDPDEFDHSIDSIKRKATLKDLQQAKENEEAAAEAFDICLDKIAEHDLPMKLVDSEYTLDQGKLLFYFTADDRVDFRELVKDLAAIFKTRIELRQIGVRDEAKMNGGLGPCGRELCCCRFLRDFEPISIQMAKEQDLALNPNKISGICGRLMCCLKYEENNYQTIKEELPDLGTKVETEFGIGQVTDRNVVKETLKVDLGKEEEVEVKATDIEVVAKTDEDQ
ncbi:PSP1 domain-containing protein [Halanaerobaculum tunisiense]